MNRILLIFLFLLLLTGTYAQQGWRSGEMEVKIFLKSQEDADILHRLKLETEVASPDGIVIRAYLIPQEFNRLQSSGLDYKVIVSDLNQHYANFWEDQLIPYGYYSYEEIVAIADSLATAFPSICKKILYDNTTPPYSLQLAALKISDNVNEDEPEPEIMFDGGIHGDEIGGPQNLIRYARDLCFGYGNDTTYTNLINSREIWLYYMVNPYGRVSMSRYNYSGVDINRDAGYMWNAEGYSPGPFSQKESKALRQCMLDNQFVVYTNYHSGTEIIAYPWSYRGNSTRDVSHIHELAGVYSDSSGYANLIYGQGYNIMYAINGSYKDVQYGCFGNVGWSIEISVEKQPPFSQIALYYNNNVPAMTAMINRAGYGVEGFVTDSLTGIPIPATIWVGRFYPVYSDPVIGDYHKYVLPGTYTIRVTANGYKSKTITNVTVPAIGSVITDFQLTADPKFYGYRVISCQIPDNNFSDEGFTPASIGAPDDTSYSLGKNGWIIIDMGDTIHDGPGDDLKVIEGGTPDEGFLCYASTTMDGQWILLDTATGTASFDLSSGPIDKARYIRIRDDNDGPQYGEDAGYDLDAVEMLTLPLSSKFTANDTTIHEGAPVNFTDLSSGIPVSWHWLFPGGIPAESTEKNPIGIIYNTEGTYDVTLVISNGLSFSTLTKADYINVSKPNSISDKNKDKLVSVFPNPSDGNLQLKIKTFKGGTYRISSGIGLTLMEGTITDDDFFSELNFTGRPAGIYFLQVSYRKESLTTKIVIF
jgi:PKD repeat protein